MNDVARSREWHFHGSQRELLDSVRRQGQPDWHIQGIGAHPYAESCGHVIQLISTQDGASNSAIVRSLDNALEELREDLEVYGGEQAAAACGLQEIQKIGRQFIDSAPRGVRGFFDGALLDDLGIDLEWEGNDHRVLFHVAQNGQAAYAASCTRAIDGRRRYLRAPVDALDDLGFLWSWLRGQGAILA